MILFLAGTSDARELAVKLSEHHDLVATVVTDSAAASLHQAKIRCRIGRLTVEGMQAYAQEIGVTAIVDASHPYAEEASKTAMATSEALSIPYIRYERVNEQYEHPLITAVDDYEQAALIAKQKTGTVMLTTGSKTLAIFTKHLLNQPAIRLIARMLPNIENMEKCKALGVSQKDIVAIQGPFSENLNRALYEQYDVTCMITKESGKVGSVDEKMKSAFDLGIEVILIKRPSIQYGQMFHTFEEVVQRVQLLGGNTNG